ncbi:MAG: M3 family peptidase [Sulfurospirillum sp.]|nr:MAG: M3 family peptidase [Sulfurospirillum sp.]
MAFKPFTLTNETLEAQKEALLELLRENEAKIEELLAQPQKSYASFVSPYQMMSEEVGYLFTPISHLNYVCNTPETEKVYNELLPPLTEYSTKLSQNEDIYRAFKEILASEGETLHEAQKKVLSDAILSFELSGVGLEASKKKRLAEINLKLSELTTAYAQNLLKATESYELLVEDEEAVKALPKSDLDAAKVEHDGKTLYRFTLQQPSFIAFMTYSPDRKLKERLYKAYTTRAPENEALITQILALRAEEAELLGFENYAQLSLETKMAKSPEDVIDFLTRLAHKAKPQAKKELAELQKFANENGFEGELAAWDIAYWSEKLKIATLDVADEAYKPYFGKEQTVAGLFSFLHKLLGITFVKVDTPVWHESVEVFDLEIGGKKQARIYVDLENRKGKRGGAWMNDWVTHHETLEGERVLPIAFIVGNFAPATQNTPSLLRPDDVVTLFHEMGHALHHMLSTVKEPSVSGINGVEWDAVEFPSQFLENFAYEKEVLQQFAKHYQSGEPLPDEMIEKLKNAKNFESAMGMLRQVEFALFDMKIHMAKYDAADVQRILDEVREEVSVMKPPAYNRFQWGFSHIFAGGYSAGYYSYKWAEVLSADAFFHFVDQGIFSDNVAGAYLSEVLQKGGSRGAMESFVAFRGAEPDVDALLRLNGIEV